MQPVGVVGAITPWNFPLYQIIAKIAPALAMGCTVVLKPSELTPLAIPMLVNAAIDARLPAGVLNIVNGEGSVVGAAIVAHPAIDKISFTGSTFIGKQVAARAASSVKRLSLELGGKSAALLLADAPLEKALNATLASCMFNSGQTCTANTRLLIPASMRAEAAEILAGAADRLIVGDPTSEHTDLGPLVSDRQRQNVRDFIVQGEREGARLIAGGRNARIICLGVISSSPPSLLAYARTQRSRNTRFSDRYCRSSNTPTKRKPCGSRTVPNMGWLGLFGVPIPSTPLA